MDGFDLVHFGAWGGGPPAKLYAYQYVNPAEIQPYWIDGAAIRARRPHVRNAKQRKFYRPSRSYRRRHGDQRHESLINYPSSTIWGCDAPKETVTSLLTSDE